MTIDPNAIAQGGTVGLILGLIAALLGFVFGVVRPGSDVAKADARTERAIAAGETIAKAFESLAETIAAGDEKAAGERQAILEELLRHRDAVEEAAPRRRR